MTRRDEIRRRGLLSFAVGLIVVSGGCSLAPKADRPAFAPPGSTFITERRDSGSFGSGTTRVTGTVLGEQTWQGRKVRAFELPEAITLSDPETGRWVAHIKDTKPLVTYDPPIGYVYPIEVGKTWTTNHRVTTHAAQRTTDIQAVFKVESYEDVTVPAGTFKVFKIRYSDAYTDAWHWWSPEHGWVKTRTERKSTHSMGPGTRDTELVSQNIKR